MEFSWLVFLGFLLQGEADSATGENGTGGGRLAFSFLILMRPAMSSFLLFVLSGFEQVYKY